MLADVPDVTGWQGVPGSAERRHGSACVPAYSTDVDMQMTSSTTWSECHQCADMLVASQVVPLCAVCCACDNPLSKEA